MRLITRGGHNWASRYPWIVEAARKIRQKRFVLDGEAVVLGVDGVSDFNALHSRKHDDEVQLYAFDIMALDGNDLRTLPLTAAKAPSTTATPGSTSTSRAGCEKVDTGFSLKSRSND